LSELHAENLMGEMNNDIQEGGYVEGSSVKVHHDLIAE
jgi:hypothetical protein